MIHVLVSGAAGYIGGAVVRHLVDDGHRVTMLARQSATAWPSGVRPWLVTDLANLGPDAPDRLASVDVVVHCAARVHVMHETATNPLAEFRRVNVEGSTMLAEAAAASGVRRFVFVSSIGVNGETSIDRPFTGSDAPRPSTPYSQSKWEAEQALQRVAASGRMALTIVRPPLVYGRAAPGNFGLLVRAVESGFPLPLGSLHALRSFISLDNLVDLIVHAATLERSVPGTFLASDGEDLSTTNFIRAIATAIGRQPRLLPIPAGPLIGLATLAGRADQVRKMAVPLQLDIAATRAAFGWAPRYTVAQSMRRALAPHNGAFEGVPT